MLKNYLKIALRTLFRQKTHSIINILGLSIGIAGCLLILCYVQDELSYDTHQDNRHEVFRIADHFVINGKEINTAMTPAAWGPSLKREFPEVKEMARIINLGRGFLVRHQDKKFNESRAFYADSTVFRIFHATFLAGDPLHALDAPYSVVITQAIAEKYFESEKLALNQSLRMGTDSLEYRITGIIRNHTNKSHFEPDLMASISSITNQPFMSSWTLHNSLYTYVQLVKDASPTGLESKLPSFFNEHLPQEIANRYKPELQPLSEIHLNSHLLAEIGTEGSAVYVLVFSIIAIFILAIACINYMTLTTARSTQRAKEVGMRKVMGADRMTMWLQFLIESLVLSFIALFFAIVITEVALPYLNELAEKNLSIDYFKNSALGYGLLCIWLFVGLGCGSYTGIFLSNFEPIKIIRGRFSSSQSGLLIRRLLVIFQFSVTIGLIIATIIISDQINFMTHKPLGFQKEHVVIIPIGNDETARNAESIKTELLSNPSILNICQTSSLPGQGISQQNFQPEGFDATQRLLMPVVSVDYDYLKTLGIEISEGRNFSKAFPTDGNAFILNEAAARKLGWDRPLGKQFEWWRPTGLSEYKLMKKGAVVGIVKDFHFASMHRSIEPLVMHISPETYSTFAIRIKSENYQETLSYLEQKWSLFEPENVFTYSFLDVEIADLYRSEEKTEKIFNYFAAVGIFIACLGLLGLVSFTIQQRTKEIGVRKILGASSGTIVRLLSKEFVLLIVAANLLIGPLAYYTMNLWLDDFAYRAEIRAGTFIFAGGIALSIALLTVSFHAIKAAIANPVKSLKYE